MRAVAVTRAQSLTGIFLVHSSILFDFHFLPADRWTMDELFNVVGPAFAFKNSVCVFVSTRIDRPVDQPI